MCVCVSLCVIVCTCVYACQPMSTNTCRSKEVQTKLLCCSHTSATVVPNCPNEAADFPTSHLCPQSSIAYLSLQCNIVQNSATKALESS